MIRFLWLVLLESGLTILNAQATLDCGKYPTNTTSRGTFCYRNGILPWFVGIPGQWETELRLGVGGDTVRFAYGLPSSYDSNLMLEDSEGGSRFFEAIVELALYGRRSYWARVLGFGDYDFVTGKYKPRDAAGSLDVSAEATTAAALDAVTALAVYKYAPNGSLVAQTTAPVVFLDQAAVRWSALITETPRDQQSQSGATVTSFAVAKLSPEPQAILIQVYDESGHLSASARTPELQGGIGSGDVYADTLAHILGTSLPVSPCPLCAGPPVFRGTVVFEGEKGGLIAPVVFRFTGSAITSVPVKAE